MARNESGAVLGALREAFSGARLRAIAGIRDAGELLLARVANLDGGDHLETSGDADVWVHYEDALTGMPGIARLFVPGNVLFAAADVLEGDSAVVARPRDAGGPGIPYLLHGDAGDASRVPAWLRTKVGLFTKKVLRLESSQAAVEVAAGGATVVLSRDGDVTATAASGRTATLVANGASLTIDANGAVTVTSAAGQPVNVSPGAGGHVVHAGGAVPVAREGSATTGHAHTHVLTAGPYAVTGTIAQNTDTIAAGQGAARVRVPGP